MAINNISGYGSRHHSNLPGTESDQGSDSEGPEEGDFDKYGLSRSVQEKLKGTCILGLTVNEPRHEKTNILHMLKQRRRSASR